LGNILTILSADALKSLWLLTVVRAPGLSNLFRTQSKK